MKIALMECSLKHIKIKETLTGIYTVEILSVLVCLTCLTTVTRLEAKQSSTQPPFYATTPCQGINFPCI